MLHEYVITLKDGTAWRQASGRYNGWGKAPATGRLTDLRFNGSHVVSGPGAPTYYDVDEVAHVRATGRTWPEWDEGVVTDYAAIHAALRDPLAPTPLRRSVALMATAVATGLVLARWA